MLVVDDRLKIPLREFSFEFARSSGPGGQNVNKVSSKAILRWNVERSSSVPDDVRERFVTKFHRRINDRGELIVSSQRFRDQGRNVADCLEKLRALLAEVARPPKKRRPTRPSHAAKKRRIEEKKRRGETKSRRRRVRRDEHD